jgi:hypothetical protein
MAITRLTDIVEVFESKWVYGDVKFGYEGEVNQDHDTQYPLMLIQPPTSTMPEIYSGREEYEFEINFYNLYTQAAQSVVKLQKRWDNLQDLANEWMDFVLKNYQDVTVEVYLNDESIEIERVKDVANDKLVQIKLVFTMSGFTKCFRPTSNFPSDYSDLLVWLSADSNATFDIPTKRVSLLGDRASTNNVAQATVANQPLWKGFDGTNDKSYISFDGTNDALTSLSNLPLGHDFTIFEVSKITKDSDSSVFGYRAVRGQIQMGIDTNGKYNVRVNDGTYDLSVSTTDDADGDYHIGIMHLHNKRLHLEYYDALGSFTNTDTDSSFDHELTFNTASFNIGKYNTGNYMKGEFNELIIFNRQLTDAEIADVKGYLNLKYKIY